jgi:PhnB protein
MLVSARVAEGTFNLNQQSQEEKFIMAVKPIPDGFHTVTPFLNTKGTAKLIDFLKAALGAEEIMRMPGPDGVVMHAEVNIGNSRLMLSEAMRTEPSSSSFYIYVNDVDALYKRAVGAGATSEAQPTDQFWGDRMATVKDPFGNTWSLATHKEDPTPEEIAKRMAALSQ